MDIQIENHGSLALLRPMTDAGRDWLAEHVPDAQYLGEAAACEPRYLDDIIQGMMDDGMEVA